MCDTKQHLVWFPHVRRSPHIPPVHVLHVPNRGQIAAKKPPKDFIQYLLKQFHAEGFVSCACFCTMFYKFRNATANEISPWFTPYDFNALQQTIPGASNSPKKIGVLVFWAFFFWRFLACFCGRLLGFCGRFAGLGGRFSEFQICGRLRPKLGKHQNYQKFLVVGSSRYTVLHVLLPYISYMLEPTTLHTEQSYNPMPHFYGFSPSSVPLKHR